MNSVERSNPPTALSALIEAIDDLLPQTQCERCGHRGCLPYARAMAAAFAAGASRASDTTGAAVTTGESRAIDSPIARTAQINRCAPGGEPVILKLAALLDRAPLPPDPDCGTDIVAALAVIDEAVCIGCTKCILACPVDAIAGSARHRHVVLAERCTGCELCVPPCPVDCITMRPTIEPWDERKARRAREHLKQRQARQQPRATAAHSASNDLADPQEKARRLSAILARA